jgi:hypothetical protein
LWLAIVWVLTRGLEKVRVRMETKDWEIEYLWVLGDLVKVLLMNWEWMDL